MEGLCALCGSDDKGSQVMEGLCVIPGFGVIPSSPRADHLDGLFSGLCFGAVVFVGWIVTEYRDLIVDGKVFYLTGLSIVLDIGRNLITLLIWETGFKLANIFCFK